MKSYPRNLEMILNIVYFYRYIKKGTALKNYAHIFAVMMRLRQLCCHRNLLPIEWQDINLNDLEDLVNELAEGWYPLFILHICTHIMFFKEHLTVFEDEYRPITT